MIKKNRGRLVQCKLIVKLGEYSRPGLLPGGGSIKSNDCQLWLGLFDATACRPEDQNKYNDQNEARSSDSDVKNFVGGFFAAQILTSFSTRGLVVGTPSVEGILSCGGS